MRIFVAKLINIYIMKTTNILSIAALSLLMLSTTACGDSSKKSENNEVKETKINPNVPQSVPEYSKSDTITVKGKLYTYEFKFHNDKQSPLITNSEGYKYYDNYVELTIYKGKTDEVEFTHTFNTNSFKQYIPENIQAQSSLVGFNFNYMELGKNDKFHFIAVVGDPDETTDIAYSIAIDINPDYSISTRIVNNVDTEPISNDMNVDPDENDA